MRGEPVAKPVWRVKLVAELEPGVFTETELARIERDAQAGLAELGLQLDEAKRLTAALQARLVPAQVAASGECRRGDRREVGGQAATAIGGCGSLVGRNCCPKPVPSVPLERAQRTLSSRSAPRRVQRICCDLAMRRFTRKLAVPSVSAVPTRCPARCRSA